MSALGLALCLGAVAAEHPGAGPVPIDGAYRHMLHSEQVGDSFVVDVALPPGFAPDAGPYPLVLLTDGNMNFPMITSLHLMMQFEGLPPAIVVGVGYADTAEAAVKRSRDFSISDWNTAGLCQSEAFVCGGARAFLGFLRGELLDSLTERYPVDRNEVTLVGHSLGGLFATWALLQSPQPFRNFVIGSSAYICHDELILEEETRQAKRGEPLFGHVYMAAGSLEENPGTGFESLRVIHYHQRMEQRLRSRAHPSLVLTAETLPGQTHMSVIPQLIYRGLRAVLQPDFEQPLAAD